MLSDAQICPPKVGLLILLVVRASLFNKKYITQDSAARYERNQQSKRVQELQQLSPHDECRFWGFSISFSQVRVSHICKYLSFEMTKKRKDLWKENPRNTLHIPVLSASTCAPCPPQCPAAVAWRCVTSRLSWKQQKRHSKRIKEDQKCRHRKA